MCQSSGKRDTFDYFDPNLHKYGFWGWNFRVQIRNLHFQDAMCANFQLKRTTVTFLAQIFPKRKLGFKIQKTNVGIRMSILEIPYVPIFRQNRYLWLFGPKFAQKWILGSEFQKSKSAYSKSAFLRYYVHQLSDKTNNFEFFGPNLPQNGFWVRNFKNLSLYSESTPPIYHVCQFSVKMNNFWFFGLNFGKLPNYVQCFGSNIVEGVEES